MADSSQFTAAGIINYFYRPHVAAPTRPTNVYLACFSDSGPDSSGAGGTEITAGSMVRLQLSSGASSSLGAPAVVGSDESATTTADLTFATNSAGASYTIQSVAVVTTSAGAFTIISKKVLSTPVEVQPGQAARILAGGMVVRSGLLT